MPLPRKRLICLAETPYYHCVSQCVRRAFLCGKDKFSGKTFEHRRQWVEDRLLFLSTVFCIDLYAFAVMSNHTHVVLCVNKEKALALNDIDVLLQWQKIHKITLLAQEFIDNPQNLNDVELRSITSAIKTYRQRLFDVSWFMRELNEPIARRANLEDDCTGHFWEGRFKSQALLDEEALAACMVYVDLNPIRANISKTLETSAHTSIKVRIQDLKNGRHTKGLKPFTKSLQPNLKDGIHIELSEYIKLLRATAQYQQSIVQSLIPLKLVPIFKQLNMNPKEWLTYSQWFEATFSIAAGQRDSLERFKINTHRMRINAPKRIA
ncbi:transposase [Aliiglaciecola sp. LCG003]|uniref:transposase n=1 Tax=Aliiglaciecola sp. LCG003 TaxID=3053655 RepID=UPI0025733CB0|nr:transposase [Aliiglaciecola sp. LCG003]WJG10349.1 transposase [Aliiglaciecola sp. LCG003]